MEKQIQLLVSLAKRYIDFALTRALKDGANNLVRGYFPEYSWCKEVKPNEFEISIYFADNRKTQSVKFGNINIGLYSDTFSMPFDSRPKELQAIHDDALNYLDNYLLVEVKNITEAEQEAAKAQEIEELEYKLGLLKGLDVHPPLPF